MIQTNQTGRERPNTALGKKKLLEQIGAYLEENLSGKITLEMVADRFDVSVSTVTQLFQKKTETTFHNYLTRLRLEKASALIREGVPLEEVGRSVGYRDHSTFYRAFHQSFGCSPREYRKKLTRETTE